MARTIVVLEGDQTGQELLEEALRVLDPTVTGVDVDFERFDLSLEERRRTKNEVVHAAARLTHLHPAALRADVLKPLPLAARFDSVALNYVLHCLPGTAGNAASGSSPAAIRSVAAVMSRAMSSARRTWLASDRSVWSKAATVPLGTWCSSTRQHGRRMVRRTART